MTRTTTWVRLALIAVMGEASACHGAHQAAAPPVVAPDCQAVPEFVPRRPSERPDLNVLPAADPSLRRPSIALKLTEERAEDRIHLWGSEGGAKHLSEHIAENTLIELWQPRGFTFIDEDVVSGASSVQLPVVPASERQGAKSNRPDVLLHGTAETRKEGDLPNVVGGPAGRTRTTMMSCKATIDVRAFSVDSGAFLASTRVSTSALHLDEESCRRNALIRASMKFAIEMETKLLEAWNKH